MKPQTDVLVPQAVGATEKIGTGSNVCQCHKVHTRVVVRTLFPAVVDTDRDGGEARDPTESVDDRDRRARVAKTRHSLGYDAVWALVGRQDLSLPTVGVLRPPSHRASR
ncbi:hypothetical protein GCM10017771_35610 [Streptomyces capitiformicae]|uniref:Uncharacterized protein n=1 Tax=Streptomyces capitiformicae TaxID=2014920 RepID=A0A919GR34_9ACTN|nr:hypothetical protein GCM10017771_35610 [Streptomyces capitiformicae]